MSMTASLYEGDMDSAYKILPHVCLVLLFTLKKPDVINIVVSALGFLYVVSCGSRGAMLCMLIFIAVYLATFKEYKRPWIAYGVLTALVVFIYNSIEAAISVLSEFANKIGMSTRIFAKLANGEFLQSSGRDTIRETLLKAIAEKPLLGYGIGGDHALAGSYAHNIVIEFWVSFGVLIGTVLLLWLLFIIIDALRKVANEDEKGLILVFVCSCLMKLFLSGTYLGETYFFFMIGLCVGVTRRYRRARNNRVMDM